MISIRKIWDDQADEFNQFDELGKDEVEQFADKILNEMLSDLLNIAHTVTEHNCRCKSPANTMREK